jgi:tetratricopeptide (TPR) repeat protein
MMTLPLVVLAALAATAGALNLPFFDRWKLLERWLEAHPEDVDATLRLGRVLARFGRHDDAIALLQRALRAAGPAEQDAVVCRSAPTLALAFAALGYETAADAVVSRWGEAHRQSGAWRAHAGRLLALSEAGLRPDPAPLGPGLALAAERGLPLLAVRLQAVHGALLQRRGADGGPALAAAAETAAATGAVLLEGWVRLLRHQAGIVAGDGARARACLAEDAVLSLRVAAMP